jgi:hypothetical protein
MPLALSGTLREFEKGRLPKLSSEAKQRKRYLSILPVKSAATAVPD